MAGEWRSIAFGQLLAEPVRNGIYKQKEFHGRGAKIVNMGELFAHPRLRAVPMKRVELSDSESDRFTLAKGDLLFARRSLVAEGAGKCSVVLDINEPTTFESSIIRARPDRTKSDSLFLYYFFNSTSGLHCLDTIRRQVAVAGITGSDLAKLEVTLPPLAEQRAIAHVLGTLDDKIELNRRMNETLEAMARAFFKSWFVDFDPVRAKAEGRDPGLPKPLADLFPTRLVDSELGEIPEGWEVGTLGDVAEHPRRSVQPDAIEPDVPYIALEHMPKRCIALADWDVAEGLESNKFEFKKGEILFGKLRPYFHKVGVAPIDGVCSTDIVVVAPQEPDWFAFVLGLVSSDEFVEFTNAGSTGTKMPRTSWADMARYKFVKPPQPIPKAFTDLLRPSVERIIASLHESRSLAALRDALLPKLISGELGVVCRKAEAEVMR
ncbi:MAG: Type I restriction enzyme EcoKI specificity protein [Candidatus Accumulibacter adjunctus]|uniref:Type I restriction enzyme EcoKI specificity protein n=1 Tax=Candidatus Accumulibacter adjunctus TaxID=1454001 RepID=A0A011NY43_9PROT|nr:MAG: Type I restriction enzyme EcoKI specificity protein [Candidatus Accumulibacter adjunctus]